MASSLPEAARAMFRLMLDLLAGLGGKIADLDKEIARRARDVGSSVSAVPPLGGVANWRGADFTGTRSANLH